MELWQLLGELHPRLVQFPIVLLLAGLLFDAAGLLSRSSRAHWAGKILFISGTVSLLFAFLCGIYAEVWAGRAGVPHHQIEWHEFLANIASWTAVALGGWRLFLTPDQRRGIAAYLIVGCFSFGMLGCTAYAGGKLVFDYGANVRGANANTVISEHDLNTLAQQQTDYNLEFSEWMHHIFGWLVLAMSVSMLVRVMTPNRAAILRYVGPLVFFGGGIFLLIFADLDLYPNLLDFHQFQSREVQLHKILALILITVGAVGLFKKPKTQSSRTEDQEHFQARLVALMALIGGALLFTHVHSVAPYANVAAGVYIAHVALGLTALAIGGVKLLDDALPSKMRWRAMIFPSLLAFESILLITYNEGLPWYIGYGRYAREGTHHGVIAPYGPTRAELTFDNDTQNLDIYLLQRFKNDPAPLAEPSPLNLIISQGYTETTVPLIAAENAAHYRGHAPFLKNATAFGARLSLPIDGGMRVGFFDPWVTPAIAAINPNEIARYACPMHEGIRSTEPGVCKICGMPLAPIQTTPSTMQHDPDLAMSLTVAPRPDGVSLLTFRTVNTISNATLVPTDLALVHEHLLHLIIVSPDFQFFDHVHPAPHNDGTFTLPYKFPPREGFLLYADITPKGRKQQVFRHTIGHAEVQSLLTPSAALARQIGDYHVEMIPQPRQPVIGLHTFLLFRLYKNGQPVTDLAPYIGAMGHCVILSEDSQTYLHCHPEMLTGPPAADARAGPDIAFHTTFNTPGRYKVWGQFRRVDPVTHQDQIIVADFVITVTEPPLPVAVMKFILDE
jgi:uncharacterized membrane protein